MKLTAFMLSSHSTDLNDNKYVYIFGITLYAGEGEGEQAQPQNTEYHYLASFFYPLFTCSNVKPDNWMYVVAISLNHPMFLNVSAVPDLIL